jgi:hypothetical protein
MKIADLTGSVRTLRVVLLSLSLGLGGCATVVYAPTGKVLTHYATDEVVPYVESTSDIPLATCGTGLGQQQLLASFGRIIGRPHMALVYTGILTAGCSEAQAFSDDLRYLRAARAGRSSDANDALIAEQNAEALTARRRYQAFRDMVAIYGKPGQESTTDSGQPGVVCPEFEGRKDQETYLLGLVTGLQAIFDDTRSGSQVGVPQNIAPEAARASQCLDNAKWWGVPEAIQAAVWSTVPGALPKGKNAWTAFAHAEQLANAAGVRLAYALAAATAENLGMMHACARPSATSSPPARRSRHPRHRR